MDPTIEVSDYIVNISKKKFLTVRIYSPAGTLWGSEFKRNTLYNALDGSHGVGADGAKDVVKTLDKRPKGPPIRNQVKL